MGSKPTKVKGRDVPAHNPLLNNDLMRMHYFKDREQADETQIRQENHFILINKNGVVDDGKTLVGLRKPNHKGKLYFIKRRPKKFGPQQDDNSSMSSDPSENMSRLRKFDYGEGMKSETSHSNVLNTPGQIMDESANIFDSHLDENQHMLYNEEYSDVSGDQSNRSYISHQSVQDKAIMEDDAEHVEDNELVDEEKKVDEDDVFPTDTKQHLDLRVDSHIAEDEDKKETIFNDKEDESSEEEKVHSVNEDQNSDEKSIEGDQSDDKSEENHQNIDGHKEDEHQKDEQNELNENDNNEHHEEIDEESDEDDQKEEHQNDSEASPIPLPSILNQGKKKGGIKKRSKKKKRVRIGEDPSSDKEEKVVHSKTPGVRHISDEEDSN